MLNRWCLNVLLLSSLHNLLLLIHHLSLLRRSHLLIWHRWLLPDHNLWLVNLLGWVMISIVRVHAVIKSWWSFSSWLKITLWWSLVLLWNLIHLLWLSSHLWWSSILLLLHLILLWHSWLSLWLRSLTLWLWSLSWSLWSLSLVHLLIWLLLSWSWSLLISVHLLLVTIVLLLNLASLLLNILSLILNSDLLSDERLLWFLEHLLHLTFRIEDSVFQVGSFAAGDGWGLEILHGDVRLLFRVKEFSEVSHDQIDVFSGLGLWASCFKKDCLLEQMEKCFVLINSLLSNLEKSSLLPEVDNSVEFSG